ncbi:MAG: DUF6933 domain-containing protein [Treponema sp.]
MVLYVTKKTKERLNIPLCNELSGKLKSIGKDILLKDNDAIFKWGVKIFYFDRRKCLQILNFASKVTVFFLIEVKVKDLEKIGDMVCYYLTKIYEDDAEALKLLDYYFKESPIYVFDALKDKSTISTINMNEERFLYGGNRLYDYIEGGILHSIKLNKDYNFDYYTTVKIYGKAEYILPAKEFKRVLKERYEKIINVD